MSGESIDNSANVEFSGIERKKGKHFYDLQGSSSERF